MRVQILYRAHEIALHRAVTIFFQYQSLGEEEILLNA